MLFKNELTKLFLTLNCEVYIRRFERVFSDALWCIWFIDQFKETVGLVWYTSF